MIKTSCRYLSKDGNCIEGGLCDSCHTKTSLTYKGYYDVFKNVTTVTVLDKGARLISCDIYGQLSEGAIKEYAADLCRILLSKGF